MRRFLAMGLAVVMLAAPVATPASAFPVDMAPKAMSVADGVQQVQFRGGHRRFGGVHRGGFGGGGYRQGGFRRGGYDGRRGYGGGAAIGAGIAGLAAGAIIGGAIANSRANTGSCASRYRSYDPASGTYLGNDGRRHSCP